MEVACLGLMVCDILVKPITKDMLDRDSGRVDFVKMSSGGDAFNVAVNLSKLGVPSGVAGKVGNDGFGRFLLEEGVKAGVGTGGVAVTNECGTSTSVVLIHTDGERTFAYYGGASDSLKEDDIDFNFLGQARVLSVGSAFGLPSLDGRGLEEVLRKAKGMGMTTVLDVTCSPDSNGFKVLAPCLAHVDIFIPSYNEASGMTGSSDLHDISGAFLDKGAGLAVIKLGSKGCYIRSCREELTVPAFIVDAVDTTGAGDAFVAGFITACTRGWPLYECGRFANAAGALCVKAVGATTGMKSMDEVVAFAALQL